MKNVVAALVVGSGIAAGASAQSASMTLMVREAGTSGWSSSVQVSSGRVECALFLGYDLAGAVGIAGAVYNIQGSGLNGDAVDIGALGLDRQPSFDFGLASSAVFVSGSTFRIDNAGDAGNISDLGISTAQNTPIALGSAFNGNNPALVFRFDINVGVGADHVIQLNAPLNQLKRSLIGVYASAAATHATSITNVSTSGATINVVVPAPASLPMLGIGGLLAARRRAR